VYIHVFGCFFFYKMEKPMKLWINKNAFHGEPAKLWIKKVAGSSRENAHYIYCTSYTGREVVVVVVVVVIVIVVVVVVVVVAVSR